MFDMTLHNSKVFFYFFEIAHQNDKCDEFPETMVFLILKNPTLFKDLKKSLNMLK